MCRRCLLRPGATMDVGGANSYAQLLVDGITAPIDCPAMARAVAVRAFEPLPMPVSGRKHVRHG